MAQVSYSPEFAEAYLRSRRDDRREHARLRCKGTAEVRFLAIDGHCAGTLLDLSVAGCCIETGTALPPVENPVVEVRLCVAGTVFYVAGVVRNMRDERRAGIEFVDVTKRKAEQIEALVAELMERERDCLSGGDEQAEGCGG